MGNKNEAFTIDFNNMDDVNSLINKLVKEMMIENASEQKKNGKGLHEIHGLNIKIDQNGISITERDEKGLVQQPVSLGSRISEPLIDMIERPDQVVVIAELHGAKKEGISVTLENVKLTIEAHGQKNYSKSIILPANVNPSTSEAKYNNGVLEISLKKGSYSGKTNQIKIV